MKKLFKLAAKRLMLFLYWMERTCLPVQKKVLLFESNVGRNYTGNPKAIFEELVEQGLDKEYKCIFVFENPSIEIPGTVIKVKRLRFRYFYYMAIAGVWISDSRFPEYIVKRKGTRYIQTWHGTPLKKLALDMESVHMDGENSLEQYKEKFRKNTSTWDYLISQNPYSSEIFRRCFDFHGEMLETGYPRNDVLFQKNKESEIRACKKKLGIPEGKKVILYAPTWRDNQFFGDNQYKFNQALDYDLLRDELAEDCIFLVKCHYLVKDTIDWSRYEGFVYDFDSKTDIAELYLVADCLITDYSSVMFDYSLLRRPMFFFAYDLVSYRDELRGFYFDYLSEIPGPVSLTTQELITQMKHYNRKEWDNRYESFLDKFNTFDKGNAKALLVDQIRKLTEER